MNITASGYIVDEKTGEGLYAATVKVTSADGGTGTFGITDSIGKFEFVVERPGKYTLDFSYVGYKAMTKEVNIFPGRGASLGKFKLTEDVRVLGEVGAVARNQRVKQVGDTVVYNADAYKVMDGASAEDLVAKMPGIEVTDDGVKAQGETVEKILVDGKAFFENDPKLALKTLPAEVVQSVAVFDKKSDQAEFTGFDDGNTVKAMDLTTKSYRRNGAFGKVYGSGGFDTDANPYYNAGFNLNFFNGDRRISMLAMSNNVNQQNFSFDDLQSTGGMGGRGGGMGARVANQKGVSRANAFGLNFNDTYLDDKLDVQGSYFFNMTRTTLDDSIANDYINLDRSSIQLDDKLSHNYSHRLDMRISYKPNDNNEIMFRPSFNYQKTDADGLSQGTTWNYALDSVATYEALRADYQNHTETRSTSESNSWNVGATLLWRHRFEKEGRTISINFDGSLSGSDSESDNNKWLNRVQTFQGSESDTKNYRVGGNVMWTEPIATNQQLSLRYATEYTHSSTDRTVGYYDDDQFRTLDSIDTNNSNKYISDYTTHAGELGYRLNSEYIRLNLGLNFQYAELDGEQNYLYWNQSASLSKDPSYTTSKSFNSLLPNLRFEWNPVQGTQLHINYRARSSAPSVSNLQQSVNTSNELAYSTGNPDLDQSIRHNLRVRFMRSNADRATNLMFFGGYSFQQDYIGTQYLTNNSSQSVALNTLRGYEDARYAGLTLASGARISRPVNMNGYRSADAGLTYGFPMDLIMSNVNFGVNMSYNIQPSQQLYYTGTSTTGAQEYLTFDSKIRSLSIAPTLAVMSNISSDLDFGIHYTPTFSKVKDTENESNNYDYLTHNIDFRFSWVFWRGFTMEHSVTYRYYTGSSMSQSVTDYAWNASLGKKFLKKNQAEIKLQAYDILDSRKNYSRSVTDSYISRSYINYMPRYFMLTFSYKIANYKGVSSKSKESNGENRGNRSPQGGEPGMPPM
jgi:hypothetical protein